MGGLVVAVVVALVGLGLLWKYGVNLKGKGKKLQLQLPPGPAWSWPLLGSLPSLGKDMPHIELGRFPKLYGPIVQIWLGQVPTVIVSSVQAARELLVTRDLEFVNRLPLVSLEIVSYNFGSVGFAPYSRRCIALRKLYKSELFARLPLLASAPLRREDGMAMVSGIFEQAMAQGGKAVAVDVHFRLFAFSFNYTTRMMFGKRFYPTGAVLSGEFSDEANIISTIWKLLKEALLAVNVGDFVPSLRWLNPPENIRKAKLAHSKMDDLWSSLIEEHREFHTNNPDLIRSQHYLKDFLDVLLLQGADGTEPLSDATIKAVLTDLFLGGTEPPPVTAEWVLAELLRHPDILRRLQAEIDSVVGRDRFVQESDLPNFPFLRCIIKETLRLRAPIPFLGNRTNQKESQLGGYRILPNSMVIVYLRTILHDPSLWENPLEFNPDRFSKTGRTSWQPDHDDFTLFPFGSGRRACPGQPLGLTMVEYAVALLVHGFSWQEPEESIDMSEALTGLVVGKKVPLVATLTPRLPAHAYARHAS